jgi:hypothetical protein
MIWSWVKMHKGHTVHLVTFYSTQQYRKAAIRLKKQALKSSLIESTEIWNPKKIKRYEPEHYKNLLKLIHSENGLATGYGFWYWKPVVIEATLKRLTEGSIVIYLDSGCYLNLDNPEPILRMQEYIQYAIDHGSFAMQLNDGEFGIMDLSERSWTRAFVLDDLEMSNELRDMNQIQAGIQFLTVNSENIAFTKKWRETCELRDFSLLIGKQFTRNNDTSFHRYDQSIFSCLYKKEGRFFLPDETFFDSDWKTKGRGFPIWAIRNRDGIDPFEIKISDLYARVLRKIRHILNGKS